MFHHFFGRTAIPPTLLATGSIAGELPDADIDRTTTITVPAGTNRLIVVNVSLRNSAGESVASVVSNVGGALTLKTSVEASATEARAELWYLIGPSTGVHVITVTFSADVRSIVSSHCYRNVHQSVPFGTAATASELAGSTGETATVDATSAVGELVIDVLARVDIDAITAGAGQTEMVNTVTTDEIASLNIRAGVSREDGAATVTMSWALAGGLHSWALLAIGLKPS